jgi:hypothetical protein
MSGPATAPASAANDATTPNHIILGPANGSATVGAQYTLTVRVDANGVPRAGVTVDFNIGTGPNAPTHGTAVTDTSGNATFSYTSSVNGTDTWQAAMPGPPMVELPTAILSDTVTVTWTGASAPPPVPPPPPVPASPRFTG